MRTTGSLYRYGLAIIAAGVALYLRYLLDPFLGSHNAYHTVWLAVVFAAWYCGLWPSIVTAILGSIGVWFFFLLPVHSWMRSDRSEIYGMLGFLLFAGAIIALGESNRRGTDARARLGAIVESSDDAIISKNLDGVITSWNRGAERIFGYTAREAIGRPITLIIPPDRLDEELRILARLRRGERIDHFETVRIRKDGTRRDISLTISPMRDSSGTLTGASKVARDITDQKDAERVLRESEISAALLRVQDEERRRMARELHDGVGQLVAAISINATRLNAEKAALSAEGARCAQETADLAGEVSRELRTISYLLHPPLLDEMGLRSALRWYIEGFAERSKIDAQLDAPEDFERLSQEYELCFFRVAQECLTNILRHSGGAAARMKLARTPKGIQLEVIDDGKGIDRETQAKIASGSDSGVGLRGMRERLRQLGGMLEIVSNGKGTTVRATLPRA